MSWVDTHCHLQLGDRDPRLLLEQASPEVQWVVVPGVDAESSRAAVRLAEAFPGQVVATAGLHPHDAARWDEQEERLTELVSASAAVGETGLDYYRNLAPVDAQRRSFQGHIEMALATRKPLIVHCRDAFADVYEMLEASAAGPQAVLHCWTGGPRWTRRFLGLGVMFSFAGPVAFETGETVRLGAALVPPERALVETDTPYLAPPPHRHLPNQPAWVALNGAALADVWGMPVEEVAAITSANAARVFLGGCR